MTISILTGDVFAKLAELQDQSVDCVVTSPPYWGLRDYGVAGQIGLEPTLGEHLDVMVRVFREVRRVLKQHGTLWLNYGDCYASTPNGRPADEVVGDDRTFRDKPFSTVGPVYDAAYTSARGKFASGDRQTHVESGGRVVAGGYLKPKDLCMIPNRLAIALQEDGWWVRSEIVWHKPNPMPESVYDRPTVAHEKVWLLTKGEDYYYDHEAIREPVTGGSHSRAKATGTDTGVGWGHQDEVAGTPRGRVRIKVPGGWDTKPGAHGTINRGGRTSTEYRDMPGVTPKSAPEKSNIKAKGSFHASTTDLVDTRNARNVWTIAPKAFREAHFVTFPPALAERCIKAGTPPTVCACCGAVAGCGPICELFGRAPGVVLDPFGGAGTVGLVADQLGRDSILIELNPEYVAIAERRLGLAKEVAHV